MDNYSPIGTFMRKAQDLMMCYEKYGGFVKRFLRERGVRFAMEYIRAEDRQTNFVDIGPVNKVYNMLCVFVAEVGTIVIRIFFDTPVVFETISAAEDGMKMQGYNGSQTWDTSFAIQAVVESGLRSDFLRSYVELGNFWRKIKFCPRTSQSTDAYTYESPSREIDTIDMFRGWLAVQ